MARSVRPSEQRLLLGERKCTEDWRRAVRPPPGRAPQRMWVREQRTDSVVGVGMNRRDITHHASHPLPCLTTTRVERVLFLRRCLDLRRGRVQDDGGLVEALRLFRPLQPRRCRQRDARVVRDPRARVRCEFVRLHDSYGVPVCVRVAPADCQPRRNVETTASYQRHVYVCSANHAIRGRSPDDCVLCEINSHRNRHIDDGSGHSL